MKAAGLHSQSGNDKEDSILTEMLAANLLFALPTKDN
jgi:hypothetical protein